MSALNPLYEILQYIYNPSQPIYGSDLSKFARSITMLTDTTVTVNISDTGVYDVATTTLTIPITQSINTNYVLTADLYSTLTTYVPGNIVRAVSALLYIAIAPPLYDAGVTYATGDVVLAAGVLIDGGVVGLSYISLANANTGNLLSDVTKWALTTNLNKAVTNVNFWSKLDSGGGDNGYVEIQFIAGSVEGNYSTFTGNAAFTMAFIASTLATLAATELATSAGSTRLIEGRATQSDYIEFITNESGTLAEKDYRVYTT